MAVRQRFCSKICHTDFWLAAGNKSGKILRFQSRAGDLVRATKHLSDKQKQVCLGALLGDGSIDLSRAKSPSLRMQHCLKQKGYLEWKRDLLQDFIIRKKPTICKPTGFAIKESLLYQTVTHQDFIPFFKLFYSVNKDGKRKKVLRQEVFDRLDVLGVLIWFLDDGCATKSQIRLHTNCFTSKEHGRIISFFKVKFGIKAKTYFLKSQNQLITIFTKDEAQKLLRLFLPYRQSIPKCMTYKFSLLESFKD